MTQLKGEILAQLRIKSSYCSSISRFLGAKGGNSFLYIPYYKSEMCNIKCDRICENRPYGHILHTALLLSITTCQDKWLLRIP